MTPELHVSPDPDTTAVTLVDALVELVTDRGSAHVGLTGGSMGVAVAAEIGRRWAAGEVDFSTVDWWFSDERHLPADDPERNALQVRHALGDAPLAEDRFHVVPAVPPNGDPDRTGAEQAAADYAEELEEVPQQDGLPVLDLVVLGVGPDAHVASLFPSHPDSGATGPWTTAVEDSPKPPPVRVSFTMQVIRAADEVWLVAAGEGKADALGRAHEHFDAPVEPGPLEVPAAQAVGRHRTRWFVDREAAGRLQG
ncbi:6-phosphogluconolactonase [Kytococcus sp. Marseille-QA3725]